MMRPKDCRYTETSELKTTGRKRLSQEATVQGKNSELPNPNSQIPTLPPSSQGVVKKISAQPRRSGKPYDLRERALDFAADILGLVARLPSSPEGNLIRTQLARAAASIGANTEEADGASSRLDKRKSLIVARKEARETRYWLRLLERRWGTSVSVRAQLQEATEILHILSSIVEKLS